MLNSNSSYQTANALTPLVNLEIGSQSSSITVYPDIKTYLGSHPKRININSDGVTITSNEHPPLWTITYPNVLDTTNPDIKTLMLQQCPNIIQCRFDYDDANLALYEKIFMNQAFIPLGSAYSIASKW